MNRIYLLGLQILVSVVVLVLWHLASTTHLFGNPKTVSFFFADPLNVAKKIVQWFVDGSIWYHLWVTLSESILAFVFGATGGVVFGFWFARRPLVASVFDPY